MAMSMRCLRVIASLIFILVGLLCFAENQSPALPDLTAARDYYLSDLIQPHHYRPGKNSFLFRNLSRGERRTVLSLAGSGSVRHLWSTWSIPGDDSNIPAPGRILVRVFVDGQSGASVTGTLDGLCRAAEATKDRYVPLPAFNYKGAYNLYLPIYFSHGIRIEIEATNAVDEFYTQIDYRLDSEVRPHARLVSEEASAGLTLKYVGEYVPAHREDKLRHLDTKSVNLQY